MCHSLAAASAACRAVQTPCVAAILSGEAAVQFHSDADALDAEPIDPASFAAKNGYITDGRIMGFCAKIRHATHLSVMRRAGDWPRC
jgi:hypothetical protein